MSADNAYTDGDIVWVKLNNVWWPGEVTPMLDDLVKDCKKKPYCLVKFFKEDFVEFVKTSKLIYAFQCQRKEEFIRKGMDLCKAKHKYMEKFPDDVRAAELYSAQRGHHADTIIIRDRPDSIVQAVMGESVAHMRNDYARETNKRLHRQSGDSITKIMNITPKLKTPALQHGRVSQATAGNNTPSTSSGAPKMLSATYTLTSSGGSSSQNSNAYRCNWCDFQTTRQNVMILHRKTHSGPTTAAVASPSTLAAPKAVAPVAKRDTPRAKLTSPPAAVAVAVVVSAKKTRPATPAAIKQQKSPATTTKAAAAERKEKEAKKLADITLPSPSPPPPPQPELVANREYIKEIVEESENNRDNDEKSEELRNNGQSLLASPKTPSPTTPVQKKNSEDIRKRLLADWSDDDEEGDEHRAQARHEEYDEKIERRPSKEEQLPSIEPLDESVGEVAIIELITESPSVTTTTITTATISNNNNEKQKDTAASNKNRSIRNIPKKDRRALKEFNTEGSEVPSTTLNADANGVVIVVVNAGETKPSPAPDIIDVDLDASKKEDDVIEVIDVDEDDVVEVPLDKSVETAPTNEEPTLTKDSRSSLDNSSNGANETGGPVPLSCFDFQEEEDNDTDVLTSIANFKKKYLSPEKPNVVAPQQAEFSEELDASICTDDLVKIAVADVPQIVQEKDLELAAEIENLLEQSSGTVSDVCAVSVKTLPIKERGKRIFKSRNRSRLEESASSLVTSLIAEADAEEERVPPSNRESTENERSEDLVADDAKAKQQEEKEEALDEPQPTPPPTNGENKENLEVTMAADKAQETFEVSVADNPDLNTSGPTAAKEKDDHKELNSETPQHSPSDKSVSPRNGPLNEEVQNGHSLSATDETSSVGISEAGAEFGSPASMLDEERFPLAATNDSGPTAAPKEKTSTDEEKVESSTVEIEEKPPLQPVQCDDEEEEEFFEEDEDEIESPPHEELTSNELEEVIETVRKSGRLGKKSPTKELRAAATLNNRQSTTPTPSPTSTVAEDSESSTTLRRSGRSAKVSASSSPSNFVTTTGGEADEEVTLKPDTNFNEVVKGTKSGFELELEQQQVEEPTKVDGEDENGSSTELPEESNLTKQVEEQIKDEQSRQNKNEPKLDEELSAAGRTRRSARNTPTVLVDERESPRTVEKRLRRKPESPLVEEKIKSLASNKDIDSYGGIIFDEEHGSPQTPITPIESELITDDDSSQNSSNYLVDTIEYLEDESWDENEHTEDDAAAEAKVEKISPNGRSKRILKRRISHPKPTIMSKFLDGEAGASASKVRRTVEAKCEKICDEQIEISDDDDELKTIKETKRDSIMVKRKDGTLLTIGSRSATPRHAKSPNASPVGHILSGGPTANAQKATSPKINYAISKKRTALKTALPTSLKRKNSQETGLQSLVVKCKSQRSSQEELVPAATPSHIETVCLPALKITTKELLLDGAGKLLLDSSKPIGNIATAGSNIITTSSGMFDINDIPMVLSNDDDDLLSHTTAAATNTASATAVAKDNGGFLKDVSEITATLSDSPKIIEQQILQPAQIPMSQLSRRATATPESVSSGGGGGGGNKQIGVDTRGNKYFIIKTTQGNEEVTALATKTETTAPALKPKSPAAAATGGRKHAGNTITLPSAVGTHRQRPPQLKGGSPVPAKIPKVSKHPQQLDLPSTSKAAQSLAFTEASTPSTVHPLLNRKPRKQPQQHRGGTTTTNRSPQGGQSSTQPSSSSLRTRQPSASGVKPTASTSTGQQQQSPPQQQQQQVVAQTPQQAVHSTTYNEEQLEQLQTDDQQLEGASKILAVPTQPIPGYNETFLLCTLVNNSYRPIDNIPLYLDNDLNQLVPVPMEALDGQPHLIVNHPPPEEEEQDAAVIINQLVMGGQSTNNTQQVLPAAGSLDTVEADSSTQYLCLPTQEESADVTESASAAADQQQHALLVAGDDEHDTTGNATEMSAIMDADGGGDAGEIVPNNALILNIEGQQIIMDSSTIAHLLANPDGNTQLVTDDGTEFVLTREVLAALEAQQSQGVVAPSDQPAPQQQHLGPQAAGPQDILAVALAGSDLYGNDVLEIETSQHLPLIASDGSIVFPSTAAALAQAHLTPPITAHTSETNAVLNPIMSTLETPSTSSALSGCGGIGSLATTSTTAALLATSVAQDLPPHQRPNLEDSLAVIGVTAPSSSVPISLELPITITNPAIAPPKTLLPPPPTDIEQFQSSSSVAELTAASIFTTDPHS